MSKYLVPITRDATETTMVDVTARSRQEAVAKALDEAQSAPEDFDWVSDEGSGSQQEAYFAGGDDYSAVETLRASQGDR